MQVRITKVLKCNPMMTQEHPRVGFSRHTHSNIYDINEARKTAPKGPSTWEAFQRHPFSNQPLIEECEVPKKSRPEENVALPRILRLPMSVDLPGFVLMRGRL